MKPSHIFEGGLRWTGAASVQGAGLGHERSTLLEFPVKDPLPGSAPAVFRGDDHRHNPSP